MIRRNLHTATPFVTKDGSTIRSLLDLSCAPVRHQSLAEATVEPGSRTTRHRHPGTEEFYFVMQGEAWLEVDGERQLVTVGDAVLIPPGASHQVLNLGNQPFRILCCCAPPYRHEDTELLPDGFGEG